MSRAPSTRVCSTFSAAQSREADELERGRPQACATNLPHRHVVVCGAAARRRVRARNLPVRRAAASRRWSHRSVPVSREIDATVHRRQSRELAARRRRRPRSERTGNRCGLSRAAARVAALRRPADRLWPRPSSISIFVFNPGVELDAPVGLGWSVGRRPRSARCCSWVAAVVPQRRGETGLSESRSARALAAGHRSSASSRSLAGAATSALWRPMSTTDARDRGGCPPGGDGSRGRRRAQKSFIVGTSGIRGVRRPAVLRLRGDRPDTPSCLASTCSTSASR